MNSVEIRDLKDRQNEIFDRISTLLGALSSPVRIKLIHFLSQAPLTVEVLSHKVGESVANTSMHLRKMLSESLVSVETIGQRRLYSLHPSLFEFWEQIQDFAQSVDSTLKLDRELPENMTWQRSYQETRRCIRDGDLILLDIRHHDERDVSKNKIPGVIAIPLSELKASLNRLPKRKPILVICRGRLCGMSIQAVQYLRQKKFKAYRLNESWYSFRRNILKEKSI